MLEFLRSIYERVLPTIDLTLWSYHIPWWVWAAPVVGGALKIGVTFARVMGWRNAAIAVFAFLTTAAFFLSRQQARQQGWRDHEAKDRIDAENLVKRVNSVRDHARSTRPNLKQLHADDGFKRTGD
jgi:hypothetical protein